jgi:para-aminobenzoate synthetase component 1
MWSSRPPDAEQRSIVEQLRRVPPSARAVGEAGHPHRNPGFVWLDGAASGHRLFTSPVAELTVRNGRATVTSAGGESTFPARGFDLLEAALKCWSGSGAVLAGYFGYELGTEQESLPAPECGADDAPDLYLGLFDRGLVRGPDGWRVWSTDAWRKMDESALPIERAEALLSEAGERGPLSPGPLSSLPDRVDFKAAVARTVARIYDGELFQTNLCRRLDAPLDQALAWPLFLRMRSLSPADHGAYLALPGGRAVASVSPELFLKVRGGRVESRPIKGTRPRGETPDQDRRLALELQQSEKDRAELAMIVDVVRNDLGRVCAPGSVSVPRHAELVTLPTVHHTVSTVTGHLRANAGPADLLRAAFPPASISGAPKIRAMEVAIEEECQRRGPCMGSIGWISMDGDLELSVAIRTAVISNGRVSYHAGGGITAGSDPENELEETDHKARAFVRALGLDDRNC